VSFNAYVRSFVCYPSDLPGFDLTTYDVMVLYYRLMTKWIGLGDSTVFSWAGCHRRPGGQRCATTVGQMRSDESKRGG
jgi:hypothetical protein